MPRALIALIATSLAAGIASATAGCGASAPTATPAPAAPAPAAPGSATTTSPAAAPGAGPRHNAADVDFARALIPHHREGIALAAAVAAENPGARTLAEAIIVTQQDEVARMTDWLQTWGTTAPSPGATTAPSGDPIKALIAHQDEAIKIAQQEQANGANLTALDFAKQIIESRTAQITELGRSRAGG